MALDTPPEIERMLIEGYRRMTPVEKLERIAELNHLVEAMAIARIRSEYGPDLPDRELRLRLGSLSLDRETMIDAFGWDPEKEGY